MDAGADRSSAKAPAAVAMAEADQDVKRERACVLSGQRLEAGVFRLGDVLVQKELVDVENHFHSDPSASSSASMSSNIGIASAGFADSDTRHPPAPASRRSASSREAPKRARLKPTPSLRNACTSAGDAGALETVVLPPVRSSKQTLARVATGAGAGAAGQSPGQWTTSFSSPFAKKVGDRPASSGKWGTAVVSSRTRAGRPHTRNSGSSCT